MSFPQNTQFGISGFADEKGRNLGHFTKEMPGKSYHKVKCINSQGSLGNEGKCRIVGLLKL